MPRLFQDISPGTSVGTSPILSQLSEWSEKRDRPVWDTILINTLTMLRNNYDKNKNINTIIENTLADIDLLLIYIERYMEINKATVTEPKVIIYIPFYHIPELYARKPSPIYLEQLKIHDKLIRFFKEQTYQMNDITVHVCKVGSNRVLPHYQLYEYLTKIDKNLKYSRYAVITSIPLDLHISKWLLSFSLLESFTGKLKEKTEFNLKIFKTNLFPFIGCFHLLLGDKVHINKAISKKNLENIFELAKKRRWLHMSEDFITKDLISLKVVDNKDFFKYKL